jgi:predicted nucleic acid-binding Zn finger protein
LTIKFENRLKEAKALVKRDSVKKYVIDNNTERWVVVGNKREYLVTLNPIWCRCYDFQHSVLNNLVTQCKHSIAVQMAIQDNKYDVIRLSKEEYDLVREDFLIN